MSLSSKVYKSDGAYISKNAQTFQLTQEVKEVINNIPWVVDNVGSNSTTDALSANQGRLLQSQINDLKGIGTFLSTWNTVSWRPATEPQENPYTYKQWNYYIVSHVASSWGTNYKPSWDIYTQWVASSTIETEQVEVNDWYIYDWTQWIRQPAWEKSLTIDNALSSSSTNAVENRVITNALWNKQDTITDINTIRSNASRWASAIQPWDNISLLTNNSGFQTAWDVAIAISNKADSSTVSALSNTVSSLQTTVANQADAIESLEAATGWDTQAITNINNTLTTIQWDITNIEWDITNIEWDITNIEWDVSTLQWDVSTLQSNVSTNANDITTLQGSVSTLQNSVQTNTNNISALQSSKQDTLVSWTNIKTVNWETLLGNGDITIAWGKVLTASEYEALPSSKLTDWVLYFIYE